VTGRGGVDVRFKGRTKIGFPLEERDRHDNGTHCSERTTELVRFSDAKILASVFEIPRRVPASASASVRRQRFQPTRHDLEPCVGILVAGIRVGAAVVALTT
jgi:hypothetical protein